jgi:hypothetical protein
MRTVALFIYIVLFGTPASMDAEGRSQRVSPAQAWSIARGASPKDTASHKPWWCSKTLWLNALAASFLLAEANVRALQGLVPDTLQKWLVFGLPIANVWLRVITSQGLSFKPKMPQGSEDRE